ncbi:uncharacterized protein NEMAJ01_1540 [Nematocida major]|uniref:uncharacterized protein n=1 Tax=Nematocida major TaxID=1912982 RepID=UPI002007D823|nr:uncharacterized protein NEMAJ01_1540 [Nematocida major]KAH9386644.1 hypothetical protein NEMAJ01_1540 [Nematocida major]
MDTSSFLRAVDEMSAEQACAQYGIKYYTVEDLVQDPVIGGGVKSLYTKNYM